MPNRRRRIAKATVLGFLLGATFGASAWLLRLLGIRVPFLAWIAGIPGIVVTFILAFFGEGYWLGDRPLLNLSVNSTVWGTVTAYVAYSRFNRRYPMPDPGPRCQSCDYSLINNLSGRCPECGESTGRQQKGKHNVDDTK